MPSSSVATTVRVTMLNLVGNSTRIAAKEEDSIKDTRANFATLAINHDDDSPGFTF